MMSHIWMVAGRDFRATVGSKGFILGILLTPALITALVIVGPRIINSRSPQVQGEVAVIDRSGSALAGLRESLSPATIAARRASADKRRASGPGAPGGVPIPVLSVVERSASADVQHEKAWLIQEKSDLPRHLALIVIATDAIVHEAGKPEYGAYELYVSQGLNDATEQTIHESLRQALVAARLETKGFDPAEVEATMQVARPNAVIVAAAGEQAAQRGFRRMLPFICGVLLFIGIFTGGQVLMTSMIEEKSSRVVEVLLSAVAPLELMWGKLIAQLGVCLLILAVYTGAGLLALVELATFGLIEPILLVYLVVFFVIGYLIFGALMLAVGAAVNQLADTQALMGPIMLLLLAPYMLSGIVGQAPNSALTVTLSFVPPLNIFVMLARVASDSPPPVWQVGLTALIGLATAGLVLWFAAKIFRIGLLMHGKPPNFATMIRWARMA